MRAKFFLISLVFICCLSFWGCPFPEGVPVDDPGLPFIFTPTSPKVSENGELCTVTLAISSEWNGSGISSKQGTLTLVSQKNLGWRIITVATKQPIDTRMLLNYFDIPITTNGDWDDVVNLVFSGPEIPPGISMEVLPQNTDPGQKKLRFKGTFVGFSGELAKIYLSDSVASIDWDPKNGDTNFLSRQQLTNVVTGEDKSSVVVQQTMAISLKEPTNEVEINFDLPEKKDLLLWAEVGELFRRGDITYSPHNPPLAQTGSFLVKNWSWEISYRDELPQVAPPAQANSWFDYKITKNKNGSSVIDIKKINNTSQLTVVRQKIENGYIFADIVWSGEYASVKIPTQVTVPAKDIPSGKLPNTWGNIKKID
ncbi:MAG: hypothetical protein V1819_02865 [bacterium]